MVAPHKARNQTKNNWSQPSKPRLRLTGLRIGLAFAFSLPFGHADLLLAALLPIFPAQPTLDPDPIPRFSPAIIIQPHDPLDPYFGPPPPPSLSTAPQGQTFFFARTHCCSHHAQLQAGQSRTDNTLLVRCAQSTGWSSNQFQGGVLETERSFECAGWQVRSHARDLKFEFVAKGSRGCGSGTSGG